MDDKNATFIGDLIRDSQTVETTELVRSAYLVVVQGGLPGAMHRLEDGTTSIGRSPDNAIQLVEETVSRRHALLEAWPDAGIVRIVDLGSTNGTLVNGKRVPKGQPVVLADGDRIQFGTGFVAKFIRPDPCEERFQRELFERGVRDPLTGLYNRAYFLDQVGPLAGRTALRGLGLAVLMLDVDHFKRVNDTHGHVAGDLVLRELAEVVRRVTRNEDLIARYGGEEFVLALPMPGVPHVMERAERIRQAVATRRVPFEGKTLNVTVSIGLAHAQAGSIRPFQLVASADKNLYRAKEMGRDRVVAGPGLEVEMEVDVLTSERSAWAIPAFHGQTSGH
jgi:diguanylate cyclase (GGDEF)-like protein